MKTALGMISVIVASVLLWIITIQMAWDIGEWVGGSDEPIPWAAKAVAFSPSAFDVIIGLSCIALGKRLRSVALAETAIVALGMASLLFMVTVYSLAMGHIT